MGIDGENPWGSVLSDKVSERKIKVELYSGWWMSCDRAVSNYDQNQAEDLSLYF